MYKQNPAAPALSLSAGAAVYISYLIKYYLSLGGIGTGHLPADVVDGVVGVIGPWEDEFRRRHQSVAVL